VKPRGGLYRRLLLCREADIICSARLFTNLHFIARSAHNVFGLGGSASFVCGGDPGRSFLIARVCAVIESCHIAND
jgi:hypothetical protein